MPECIFCDDTRERLIVTNRQDRKDIAICNACVQFVAVLQSDFIRGELEYQSWFPRLTT